jgi:hypothetical protein
MSMRLTLALAEPALIYNGEVVFVSIRDVCTLAY